MGVTFCSTDAIDKREATPFIHEASFSLCGMRRYTYPVWFYFICLFPLNYCLQFVSPFVPKCGYDIIVELISHVYQTIRVQVQILQVQLHNEELDTSLILFFIFIF